MRALSFGCTLLASLGLVTAETAATELLTNPSVEIPTAPLGWDLEEFATNPAITENVNSAATAGFANQELGGTSGIWLRAFSGQAIGNGAELTNAILSQTVPATPGESYTLTGYSLFEANYAGGVTLLDPLSPLGEVPSPTETSFSLEFLDGGGSVIGTPETLDLSTVQFNGFGWAQHTLTDTAPAGTASARVVASAIDMAPNIDPGQSAFFDTFSLTADSAPAAELLTNENFELGGTTEPNGWARLVGEDTGAARYEGFASRTGANGFWLAPRSAMDTPQDALFAQTLPASPGVEYEFGGWSFWEPEYPGGVETLNADSSWGAIASDTETYFSIEFLDDDDNVLDTTLLDLSTVQQNDATWRESFVSATAPNGTTQIQVGVLAESLRSNREGGGPFDDAYFDDFSLTIVPTLLSDYNGDGTVDLLDLDILGLEFGMSGPDLLADSNNDGTVDLLDLDILGLEFGMTSGAQSVPEPTAALLAAIAVTSLTAQRRRGA